MRLNIPVFHRSELLNFLSRDQKLIAVTGTHGKTTTSAMVGQTLLDCGFDPSVVVGGVRSYQANSYHGKGQYFVAESDESKDGTHASATPHIALITNMNRIILKTTLVVLNEYRSRWKSLWIGQRDLPLSVVKTRDAWTLRRLEARPQTRMVTYGTDAQYSYRLVDLGGKSFEVWQRRALARPSRPDRAWLPQQAHALSARNYRPRAWSRFYSSTGRYWQFCWCGQKISIDRQKSPSITIVDDYAITKTVIALLRRLPGSMQQMRV